MSSSGRNLREQVYELRENARANSAIALCIPPDARSQPPAGYTDDALGRKLRRLRTEPVVVYATSQEPTQKTGVVCPVCKEAYGAIEDQQPMRIVFKCLACGHRWRWDDPWPERS